MLLFSNAKINIGLNIVGKRTDGYHNIETIFYPIQELCDALEIVESQRLSLNVSGQKITDDIEDNLIVRAYRILQHDFELPSVMFYLKKTIPTGAGLGGGSSNAAFTLKALNQMFCLGLTDSQLGDYAQRLGADCRFFVKNKPAYAEEKGDVLSDINLNLTNKYLVLVKPNIHISTQEAYAGVKIDKSAFDLRDIVSLPIEKWSDVVKNDFEKTIFRKYPLLDDIKNRLYSYGALYASMSGSGSTVYGLFDQNPINFTINPNFYTKILML
ncbi:MAG: 4-(cytidine 5'-diphospho)-2-C-methyl-D-erythritol kinase [Bacteroidales bacterium]|nr:MAG: 4-(cytidine 5'-diphospho)-2-C-methyl-D-erythritol kinase [Bacteroidales bacterium]